jgi:hypothetical protein
MPRFLATERALCGAYIRKCLLVMQKYDGVIRKSGRIMLGAFKKIHMSGIIFSAARARTVLGSQDVAIVEKKLETNFLFIIKVIIIFVNGERN